LPIARKKCREDTISVSGRVRTSPPAPDVEDGVLPVENLPVTDEA
jgi:hypothetical protein